MIAALRGLNVAQQRQLIGLLDPRAALTLDGANDQEVFGKLVSVLRRVLDVPVKDDLPEYLRRRLVEATKRHFELVADTDKLTDLELARLLVDFVLDEASDLASDRTGSAAFAKFLRTKSREDRTVWLVQSQQVAALLHNDAFDPVVARQRAESLGHNAGESVHDLTAQAILDDLASISVKGANTPNLAFTSGQRAAAQTAAVAAVALGPALAVPVSVLAGGLFMAGRTKRKMVKVAADEADKTRLQRARRSKQVQAIVALSAFIVAAGTTGARAELMARQRDRRYRPPS